MYNEKGYPRLPTIATMQMDSFGKFTEEALEIGAKASSYRRIPKVTAPVTFGFCRQKGPLLSGSRYFRIGKKRLSLEVVLDKEDTYYAI